jgi:hypothetical protein
LRIRLAGWQVVRSYPPMATDLGEVTSADYYQVEFYLGWWSLLFS